MFFKKRRKINELTNECKQLKNDLQSQLNESFKRGDHLKDNPFIPEYLGFEENVLEDKETGAVQMRIYTKLGYNISRPVNESSWYILVPEGQTIKVSIKSMYDAICILSALGMDVSVDQYYQINRDLEKMLVEKVDEAKENADKMS